MRARISQIEAIAISASGFTLLVEIARAVRWNLFWMDRAVVTEPRFSLYVGTALSLSVLLIIRGVTARNAGGDRAFIFIEAPLTLIVSTLLITVVHGWRIRTDVAPLDRASTDVLPPLIRLVASSWTFYGATTMAAALVAVLFLKALRAPALQTSNS